MAKRIKPLSDDRINTAKPKDKDYRLFDGGGLYLLVTTMGGKRWRFKYRYNGKAKVLSFGTYPLVNLAEARSSRDSAQDILKQGIDPSIVRKEEKERDKAERLEAGRTPSVRVTIEGIIEIWKGSNVMRFSKEEAQFIANIFTNLVR